MLSEANPSPKDRDVMQELVLTHKFKELVEYVVVVQEAFSFVLVDATICSVNLFEHFDDLIFDLSGYVRRLLSGDCEEDVGCVLDVSIELKLSKDFLEIAACCFKRLVNFSPNCVEHFYGNVFALSSLKLSYDFFEVVQAVIHSLRSRAVVVDVIHDELWTIKEATAVLTDTLHWFSTFWAHCCHIPYCIDKPLSHFLNFP